MTAGVRWGRVVVENGTRFEPLPWSSTFLPTERVLMNTTVIRPSTGPGAHAGVPSGDPGENIRAVRLAVRGVADLERDLAESRAEVERLQALEVTQRSALRRAHERAAELGLRLVRADEGMADLADQAWRLEQENRRLSAENRVLRDRLEWLLSRVGSRRSRHRGDRP